MAIAAKIIVSLVMVLFGWSTPGLASSNSGAGIRVIDLTPRFMSFYSQAIDVDDLDARFQLWKEHYDFVALPPGLPDRDERAREMLDRVWPRYAEAEPHIRAGASILSPLPETVVDSVVELLGAVEELPPMGLLYFVGMFEDNAFFAPNPDGSLFVAVPAEMAPEKRKIAMAHEFVHAVHFVLSGLLAEPKTRVADVVFTEGLAMHATRALFPELPDLKHLSASHDWLQECNARLEEIMAGIVEHLLEENPEAVNRFTVGEGTAGLEREAYCVGWHVVDQLLFGGSSFAELSRIPRSEIPSVVSGAFGQ
ncbi:hypothetical protein [Wenzhouxiangella sp. XN24]|uniref:hypothetical protein n=1 Tax=Wenzhouxiangella sp. XN24 TaxID=2713569 RepID=UPI0013E9B848|nr:hypothetical protein [Wenzhouxiangella sp. XN24]NGX16574.1 hypothetical protein [Wenzhouxiangella sp. XN24]